MNSILANIVDNPILLRELRRRMRGKALIYSIITYIMMMTISTVFVLLIYSPSPWAEASIDMLQSMQRTGERLFLWITGIQILLVLIVAPTITAGMTTGEKERKTFEFLRVTTITRWMYVLGCFFSTAFYVALALLCALPLLSLTFLYGGVTLEDVIQRFFYLLGGSCVLSGFGLFISSVCERTRTAQGIIVFMIFAVLFGGFIFYQEFQVMFAGSAAATAATGASRGFDMIYLFNIGIPFWLLIVGGLFFLSAIFLLVSARKLFEPGETRAFSHWQFGLLFLLYIVTYLGFLGSNAFTSEIPELFFFLVGYLFLLVGVHGFAIGRMEVGDEIWHLKRLFPFLRPFDQTVPFLAIIAFIWYIAIKQYPPVVLKQNLSAPLVQSLMITTISSFAFLCAFGRAMTAVAKGIADANRLTFLCIVGFIFVLPIIGGIVGLVVPSGGFIAREIAGFSPIAILIDGFRNPTAYSSGATGYPVGIFAAMIYAALTIITAAYGEIRRYKRWRHFDYHYDMPGR